MSQTETETVKCSYEIDEFSDYDDKFNDDVVDKTLILVEKENEIKDIIKSFHESFSDKHLSIFKTIQTIKKNYKIDKLISKVQKFVRTCRVCKKNKKNSKFKKVENNDLRFKLKSVVGYSNTKELNETLRLINNS